MTICAYFSRGKSRMYSAAPAAVLYFLHALTENMNHGCLQIFPAYIIGFLLFITIPTGTNPGLM